MADPLLNPADAQDEFAATTQALDVARQEPLAQPGSPPLLASRSDLSAFVDERFGYDFGSF